MDVSTRAYSVFTVKAVDRDQRIVEGLATSPTTDRDGDVIEPGGAKFVLPMPFLWQHNQGQPIGEVLSATVTKAGIRIKAKIAASGVLPHIDDAWALIKAGLVKGLSIGFRPIGVPDRRESGGFHIRRWEWFETSAVTIPANASATITAVKHYGQHPDPTAPGSAVSVYPGASGSVSSTQMKKTIGERLSAAQADLKAKNARLDEIDELDTPSAEELEEQATLTAEIKALDSQIETLEAREKAQMRLASPVQTKATAQAGTESRQGLTSVEVKDPELPPGIGFARMVLCQVAGFKNHRDPLIYAKQRYPSFTKLHKELMLKGTIDPGQAGGDSSPSWGGELSHPETLQSEFIEYLQPQTIIGKFGVNGVPSLRNIPFNVRITGRNGAATAGWVGEAVQKPVTSMAFLETYHYWHKLAAITVITDELARFSSPSAESLVRDALRDAIVFRMDLDFIDPDKASATGNAASPASILNGVTPVTTAGTDADSVSTDVAAMAQTFIDANMDLGSAVLVMPPGVALKIMLMRNANGVRVFPDITRNGGSLEGFPVITSQHLATIGSPDTSIVAMVSAQDIYLSDDGQVSVDVSREASIEMSDDPTSDSVTPVSMYQSNQIALRAERFITWSKRRTTAATYVAGVAYTPLIS